MDKKTAVVFPGQGSQSLRMLVSHAEKFPKIVAVFDIASQILGYDLWSLCNEGPLEKLNTTEHAQPALLTAGFALWSLWQEAIEKSDKDPKDCMPSFLAGHSLGEYTALVCAQGMHFSDAVKLVAARGRLMQEAVPLGKGAMLAIVGLSDQRVREICEEAAQGEILAEANFNSLGQTVLSGEKKAIERALYLAETSNAKMAKILPVSVPSHCFLMETAARQLKELIDIVEINPPLIPVINNVDVACYESPEKIRDALVRQLCYPVRWVDTIKFLQTSGVDVLFECGPGKVLSGLIKRIDINLRVETFGNLGSFMSVLTAFENNCT